MIKGTPKRRKRRYYNAYAVIHNGWAYCVTEDGKILDGRKKISGSYFNIDDLKIFGYNSFVIMIRETSFLTTTDRRIILKTIVDINQLSLPEIYKETLLFMVSKLQEFSIINDIILFGSCARQDVSNYSDIYPCDVIFIPKDAFG